MSQTLERGISLLMHLSDIALGQGDPKVALKDIASAVSLDKATAFRLLRSLEKFKLVEDDGKGNYWIGSASLVLSQAASRTNGLISQAIPVMRELAAFTGETISLAERRDLTSVTLYEIESAQAVRYANKIGVAAPLHAGAGPRAILAFSDESVVNAVLAMPMQRFNPDTITDAAKLARELSRCRKDGYAVSSGERVSGTNSISVPLCGIDGNARGALSILWPTRGAAIDRERLRDWPQKLVAAARHLHVGFQRQGT